MSKSDQTAVTTEPAIDMELVELKERSTQLGMPFHPSIGKENLKKKLKAFIKKQQKAAKKVQPQTVEPTNVTPIVPPKTQEQLIAEKVKAANRLIRCRVTCMDPNKKDWEGEIITVSNSIVPTIKKYISFTADAWHIPQMILNVMKEKKCTVFKTVKGPRGEKIRKGYQVAAYNIEMLDPLTEDELDELAKQQALAGNIG